MHFSMFFFVFGVFFWGGGWGGFGILGGTPQEIAVNNTGYLERSSGDVHSIGCNWE